MGEGEQDTTTVRWLLFDVGLPNGLLLCQMVLDVFSSDETFHRALRDAGRSCLVDGGLLVATMGVGLLTLGRELMTPRPVVPANRELRATLALVCLLSTVLAAMAWGARSSDAFSANMVNQAILSLTLMAVCTGSSAALKGLEGS